MSGVVAEMSRYGKMKHISIAPTMADGTEERDFEDAVKIAGLKTAVYLARCAEGHPVDEVDIYELDIPNLLSKSDLLESLITINSTAHSMTISEYRILASTEPMSET